MLSEGKKTVGKMFTLREGMNDRKLTAASLLTT